MDNLDQERQTFRHITRGWRAEWQTLSGPLPPGTGCMPLAKLLLGCRSKAELCVGVCHMCLKSQTATACLDGIK